MKRLLCTNLLAHTHFDPHASFLIEIVAFKQNLQWNYCNVCNLFQFLVTFDDVGCMGKGATSKLIKTMKTIKDFCKAQFQSAVQYQLKLELALLSQVTTTITTRRTRTLTY